MFQIKNFDKILFITVLVCAAAAFIAVPKERLRLFKTNITFSVPDKSIIDKEALQIMITEFQNRNGGIAVHMKEGALQEQSDLIAFEALMPPAMKNAPEEVREAAANVNVFYYNITMLEGAGLDRPPKTRTALLEVCKKLTSKKTKTPFGFSDNAFLSLMPWFYAGALVKEGEEIKSLDWGKNSVRETLLFLKNLIDAMNIRANKIDDLFKKSEEELVNDFISGNCAMMIASSSYIKTIRQKNKRLNFSVTTIPQAQNYAGRPPLNLSIWSIARPAGGRHKKEALLFINFISGNRGELAALSRSVPGVQGAFLETGAADEDPLIQKLKDIYEGSEIVSDLKLFANPLFASDVLEAEVKSFLRGRQSAEDAASKLAGALE